MGGSYIMSSVLSPVDDGIILLPKALTCFLLTIIIET